MLSKLKSDIAAFIASLNLDALHDPFVSLDLKVMAEKWDGEVALDDIFFNALRYASWRRRFASNYAGDLSRTAVTRAAVESANAAIPMKARVR